MRRTTPLLLLAALGCVPGPGTPAATPPAPGASAPEARYRGRTAARWGEDALDADRATAEEAVLALGHLGAAGAPFLLDAAEKSPDLDVTWLALRELNGALVGKEDLPRVARFLDKGGVNSAIRGEAARCLIESGSAAHLVRVRRMAAEDPDPWLRQQLTDRLRRVP